jgi:hypothetical protein
MTSHCLCPTGHTEPVPDSIERAEHVWLNHAVCPATALETLFTGTGYPLPDLGAQGTGAESKTRKSYIRRQRLGLSEQPALSEVPPQVFRLPSGAIDARGEKSLTAESCRFATPRGPTPPHDGIYFLARARSDAHPSRAVVLPQAEGETPEGSRNGWGTNTEAPTPRLTPSPRREKHAHVCPIPSTERRFLTCRSSSTSPRSQRRVVVAGRSSGPAIARMRTRTISRGSTRLRRGSVRGGSCSSARVGAASSVVRSRSWGSRWMSCIWPAARLSSFVVRVILWMCRGWRRGIGAAMRGIRRVRSRSLAADCWFLGFAGGDGVCDSAQVAGDAVDLRLAAWLRKAARR